MKRNLLFLETTSITIFPVWSVLTMKWAFSIVFSMLVAIALKSLLLRLPIIEIATISKMIRSKNDTRSPIIVRRTGRGMFLISLLVKKSLEFGEKPFLAFSIFISTCCVVVSDFLEHLKHLLSHWPIRKLRYNRHLMPFFDAFIQGVSFELTDEFDLITRMTNDNVIWRIWNC